MSKVQWTGVRQWYVVSKSLFDVPIVYIFLGVVHRAHCHASWKLLVVETSPMIVTFIGKMENDECQLNRDMA